MAGTAYFLITKTGYENLPVPEAFRANRGRMYESVPSEEDPEAMVQGDEIVPSFKAFNEFLGNPGGAIRELVIAEENYVLFGIPELDGNEIEALRALALANNKALPDILYNAEQARGLCALHAYAVGEGDL